MRTLIKRGVLAGILSAVMASAPSAEAKVITVTIRGTVASGTSGGAPWLSDPEIGPFGSHLDLTGLPFVLVYQIDDAKGSGVLFGPRCGTAGPFLVSRILSEPTSNPIVASLTINGASFAFGGGGYDEAAVFSSAIRVAAAPCNPNSRLTDSVEVHYGYTGSRYAGGSYVNVTLVPAAKASLTSDADIDAPMSATVPAIDAKHSVLAFVIQIRDRSPHNNGPVNASGHLSVQSVTVE